VKGECQLELADLMEWGEGLELLVLPPDQRLTLAAVGEVMDGRLWKAHLGQLAARFPGHVSLGLSPRYDGQDAGRFQRLARVAAALGVPTVATALPFLHHGKRRRLGDVVTAVRLGGRVDRLVRKALTNSEVR